MNISIGPLGILLIVFITLKLCNVIAWSWWWVLSPLWIPFTIAVGFFLGALIVSGLIAFFK